MALNPGTPISAKFAKISIGYVPNSAIVGAGTYGLASGLTPTTAGTHLFMSTWEIDPSTDPADTSNFEGNGFTDRIGTLQDVSGGTFSGFWDAGQNPYDSPLVLQASMIVGPVAFFVKNTDGPYFYFFNILIVSSPTVANVRDAVRFSGCRFQNKGQFFYPSGQPSSSS